MSKRPHRRYRKCFAAVALAAAACDGFGLNADTIVLRTDRSDYVATYLLGGGTSRVYDFRIVVQVANLTQADVYLRRCYPTSHTPIYDVVLEGDGGAAYNPGGWACVGHDEDIRLPAQATRVDTLHIRGPNSWDVSGQPKGALTGRMRLRYPITTCRGTGSCPHGTLGATNAFRVELAPQ